MNDSHETGTTGSGNTLETERLSLRELNVDDAPFMLRLLNEPSFLHYIGDKGVRTLADAREHIRTGPIASYREFGFGLNLVRLQADGRAIGICGLLKREVLDDPDIGVAFLPEYWSKGYAFEAATAVLSQASNEFGLKRIVAVTAPGNDASIQLLGKLGFVFEKTIDFFNESAESNFYVCEF